MNPVPKARRAALAAALALLAAGAGGGSPPAAAAENPPAKPAAGEPAPTPAAAPVPEAAPAPKPDPTQVEVVLPGRNGWTGTLVYENDVGVWTVESWKIFPAFGAPEVVGLDDKGRLAIAYSYSGKWYKADLITDGKWLGGLEFMDLDPRVPGPEIYTGGEKGNLYQVVAHRPWVFSVQYLGSLPGGEIHTLVGGDILPDSPGNELVLFAQPRGLYLVTPRGEGREFDIRLVEDAAGRVRDAILLPPDGGPPRIATASRDGSVRILRFPGGKPAWETVYERPQGFGRLALRKGPAGAPVVLYSTCDDGTVQRHEERRGGGWTTETLYNGPQGPRGVVAGRFDADPEKETIAVYGYGKRVQLLVREPSGWRAETIFEDRDKGHWMCTAELDGRNGTDEILISGFGSRVIQLARDPGYGRPGIPTDPDAGAPGGKAPEAGAAAPR